MNNRFSGNNSGFRRRNERERLFFIAAAGLAFSLLIISLVVFNFKTDAVAKNDIPVKPENPIPKPVGSATLFTPEKQIPQGTLLKDVKFKEVYWPHDQIPEGAVRDLAEIKNMYAKELLRASVPIQRSMLSAEQVQFSLPVTPGNRAVAIQLDAYSGVEGHIRPGSRVDVTLTYYEQGELTTKMIVQNARVLSYGGVSNNNRLFNDGSPKQIANSATLDVSPQDALKILTSKKLGALSLILRNDGDAEAPEVTEVDENGVNGSGKSKAKQNKTVGCGVAKVGGAEIAIPCNAGAPLAKIDEEQIP